jgi:pilus assembly protein CpaB
MRSNKSLILLVFALGCGLVAALGISQILAKRNAETGPAAESDSIYVAAKDIALGDFLSAESLVQKPWPKDTAPAGSFTKIEDINGRRTKTKLYAGEPILENKLFQKGSFDLGADALIPKGYRAVPVKVDNVSGAAGMILPGSRVDVMVYLTRTGERNISETATRTVLQDIKVFAINNQVTLESKEQDSAKSAPITTISLLVTPPQAAKLTLASEMGKIKLVMRNPEDDVQTNIGHATPEELFDKPLGAERSKESLVDATPVDKPNFTQGLLDSLKAAKDSQPLAVAPQRLIDSWTMRVITPDKVNDVILESAVDSNVPTDASRFWKVQDRGKSPVAITADNDKISPPQPSNADKPKPVMDPGQDSAAKLKEPLPTTAASL